MDLSAYFQRIGLAAPVQPTLAGLEALHLAHASHIPFENLDVQLGLPIRLDLEALEDKLVRRRRGGYCFEHNTLFAAVLDSLGFPVETMEARVRLGGTTLRGRTHMALRVTLEDSAWLVDVGFGGEGPLGPVPWDGSVQARFGETHRLGVEGRRRVLQRRAGAGWEDFYILEEDPAHPIDFALANHYTSTHPDSGFVQRLTAQLPMPGAHHILRDRTYTVLGPQGGSTREVGSPEELLDLLREVFGLDFPPGTRFRNPAF